MGSGVPGWPVEKLLGKDLRGGSAAAGRRRDGHEMLK